MTGPRPANFRGRAHAWFRGRSFPACALPPLFFQGSLLFGCWSLFHLVDRLRNQLVDRLGGRLLDLPLSAGCWAVVVAVCAGSQTPSSSEESSSPSPPFNRRREKLLSLLAGAYVARTPAVQVRDTPPITYSSALLEADSADSPA